MITQPFALALALRATLLAAPAAPIPAETQVHLGLSFRLTHTAELAGLRHAQQNPGSADYKRWLTPEEFGERFGQPASIYERAAAWIEGAGLEVTLAPNRTFLQARGRAAQVSRLLGIRLDRVEGKPASVHVPSGTPQLPTGIQDAVLSLTGLDTRTHFSHRIPSNGGGTILNAFGPQDLRSFYDIQALLDEGYVGQGQQTVVLSTAEAPGSEASVPDIEYFLQNVSDARATFQERTIPNPQQDFDQQPGGGLEFELDAEMQSVGAPGADSITLDISPASEIFSTGANDVANNLPGATSVSISLGTCEQAAQQSDAPQIMALRNTIIQGTMEGQTWSAATGDTGANDCQDGATVSVDFPASIPEMVAAGGSELRNPAWDNDNALTAYQQEVVWNDGAQGGAAGGGLSQIYPTPTYQAGLGVTSRSLPDLSLMAGLPGVASDTTTPGQLYTVEGTSIAAPLSAGLFALIASRTGCRLGDVHTDLYALGRAQFDGGVAVYHDIVSGNVSAGGVNGPSAAAGFDSASGWGSLDVLAIANAWPACPVATPDGGPDAGPDAGPDGGADAGPSGADAGTPYTQCGFIGCADGGCSTLPEGPSTCSPVCGAQSTCVLGDICSSQTVFSALNSFCVPGCNTNADCAAQPGTVCSECQQTCVPAGKANAAIGDGCNTSADCPSGAFCESMFLDGGYCTVACTVGSSSGAACSCPAGSSCQNLLTASDCVENCPTPGVECARAGYLCQPQGGGSGACLPACQLVSFGGTTYDTCQFIGAPASDACDQTTGFCGGPAVVDAGFDAGPTPVPDAGPADAGAPSDAGPVGDAGNPPPAKSGCGCMPGATSPDAFAGLLALAALALRRRRL